MGTNRYSEQEVVDIVRRATELQSREETVASGSIDDAQLQALAEELGIDRVALRRALAERGCRKASMWDRLFGGPLSTQIESTFDGEISDQAWNDFLLDVRKKTGYMGTASVRPGTYEWQAGQNQLDPMMISADRANGKTRVSLTSDMSAMLVPFGALALLILAVTSMGIHGGTELSLWIRLAGITLTWVLGWLAFRAIFGVIFRGRHNQLVELEGRFEQLVERPTAMVIERERLEESSAVIRAENA